MSLLDHLHRIWLERRIRVLSVDLARGRDRLDDLEAAYRADSYNSALHYDILHERDRLHNLEDRRNLVQAQLSEMGAVGSSP